MKASWFVGLLVISMVLGVRSFTIEGAAAVTYLLEDVSPFFPTSINNKGHMAGQWCDGLTGCFPAVWYGPGDVEVMSEHLGVAWSINARDEVVFEGEDPDSPFGWNAWFWSAATGKIPLSRGETGYEQAVPLRLNDAQQIVGTLQNFHSAGACPVRWASPTSAPECLTPFASQAGLQALNQGGVAAGFWSSDLNGEDLAFTHAPQSGLSPIPFGPVAAINDKKLVLYESSHLLLTDGTLQDPVEVPNCENTMGIDLNQSGWLLGRSQCEGVTRGWVRDTRLRVIDLTQALNDPAWRIEFPFALNAQGDIVAWGMKDGVLRGVRLTPRVVAIVRSRLGR